MIFEFFLTDQYVSPNEGPQLGTIIKSREHKCEQFMLFVWIENEIVCLCVHVCIIVLLCVFRCVLMSSAYVVSFTGACGPAGRRSPPPDYLYS